MHHYLMRCDKINNNRLDRGDMLNISALGNLMLPRGNIKLPRADIFNRHPPPVVICILSILVGPIMSSSVFALFFVVYVSVNMLLPRLDCQTSTYGASTNIFYKKNIN